MESLTAAGCADSGERVNGSSSLRLLNEAAVLLDVKMVYADSESVAPRAGRSFWAKLKSPELWVAPRGLVPTFFRSHGAFKSS